MVKNESSFSNNLKKYRNLRGLTQDKLGELVECSGGFISELEMGRKNPSYDIVVKLAKKLDISLDQLTYDIDTPNDDFFIKEALMYREKMNAASKKLADHLLLDLLRSISEYDKKP